MWISTETFVLMSVHNWTKYITTVSMFKGVFGAEFFHISPFNLMKQNDLKWFDIHLSSWHRGPGHLNMSGIVSDTWQASASNTLSNSVCVCVCVRVCVCVWVVLAVMF